ncbi:hypothetical protein J6590_044227 [Homalodisca vitripennis]|nr:hypothetical protein J6590_044227 [Homalodisca vitripennis]
MAKAEAGALGATRSGITGITVGTSQGSAPVRYWAVSNFDLEYECLKLDNVHH